MLCKIGVSVKLKVSILENVNSNCSDRAYINQWFKNKTEEFISSSRSFLFLSHWLDYVYTDPDEFGTVHQFARLCLFTRNSALSGLCFSSVYTELCTVRSLFIKCLHRTVHCPVFVFEVFTQNRALSSLCFSSVYTEQWSVRSLFFKCLHGTGQIKKIKI